jgi:hypothetical protein
MRQQAHGVRHRLLRALGCCVALALHTNNHGSREVILGGVACRSVQAHSGISREHGGGMEPKRCNATSRGPRPYTVISAHLCI